MIQVERGTSAWNRAWAALQATGRDIDSGWMLMYAEKSNVPGGLRFTFKHHDLPFMPGDPAYDGRTKYIQLPS